MMNPEASAGLATARQILYIRRFEETLLEMFSQGLLSGTTHTCIGQEAISAALMRYVLPEDVVFGSHRAHGHYLAYGGPPLGLMAEIMGRRDGVCGGRGGSQHVCHKNFFTNGIQGGIVSTATGAALAEKLGNDRGIAVVFLGDGTLGEGLVYEALNMASLWDIPVLYLLENNQYAQSTPMRLGVSGKILDRPAAFGIAASEIRSNDLFELAPAMESAVRYVRERRKPFFQVVHTYRMAAHSKGDDNRDPAEMERARADDPVRLLERHFPRETLAALAEEVRLEVRELVAQATLSPSPTPEEISTDSHESANPVEEPSHATSEADPTYLRSLNVALHRLFDEDPSVTLIGEDVLDPYGGAFKVTKGLSAKHPGRVFTSPISEAAIVGISGGMALRGRKAVAEIMFGDFVTLAADQIINHAAKYHWMYNGQVDVPLTIRTPMGGRRGYGPTHSQSLEKIFFGIPGLAVVSPSHVHDVGALLHACVSRRRHPTLFVENKLLYPRRLMLPSAGKCGLFSVRSSGRRFPTLHLSLAGFERPAASILTYGGSAPYALEAAEKLMMEHEIAVDVVIPSLIAPIPKDDLVEALGDPRVILTLEEGTVRNGWGAELIASLCEGAAPLKARFARMGAPDCPVPNSKDLEAQMMFDADRIVDRILRETGK